MLGHGHLLEDPEFQQNKQSRLKLKWYRPDRVFGNKYFVFREINPHGIKQGSIGDCYWLSAISAVSEFKDRIRRVMISQDTSKSGVYCVTLCINGIWQDIIIDDHFPYDEEYGGYAFNTTEHPEIWVSLLQKAWAKVHGGYFNTEGGYTSEAVQCLTGAPTADYVISEGNDDVNWRRILEGERKDYIMCASTGDFAGLGNDSKDDKTGLAGNHAYSLLAAYELKKRGNQYELVHPSEPKSPEHIKLLKIRNPWGSGEWTGNWRDNDPKWNPTLMKQVGHVKADDGIFFMDLQDFKKFFEDYSITYYNPAYTYCA